LYSLLFGYFGFFLVGKVSSENNPD
jgi:hypothetical protein